ncbi:energy transducer TonB [Hymenobacter sp. HDW8]|uniref:energy transducer TonB n=1 Tax=Hymenobacter sp. HDW8 TaxID=2714932 RepID=UPI00140723A1|nr:TonB family protein [Hymenobacter sp. HDW8]QIL75909.1 TonB family protein [Hymenobacter sp. HDW8]
MPLLRSVRRLSLFLLVSAAGFSSAQAQQKLKAPKPDADEIYDSVGQPAVPVGGVEAYAQYLADNQRYPTGALQRGVQGTAPVTFVVEKSGVISSVAVTQPLDPELDQEAIRLIKGGPKWTPAQHRGQKFGSASRYPYRLLFRRMSLALRRPRLQLEPVLHRAQRW